MIGYGEAVILGIIQGLTEFIPISSTAHLRIITAMLGWKDPGAAYSAVIQLGTLFALIVFFRKDLLDFSSAALRGIFNRDPFADHSGRMAWYLVLGTIPVSVFGLLFSGFITKEARSLYVIASSLIILAIVLWTVDRLGSRKKEISATTWKDFLMVGFAQSLALIPGSSRSGTTLTMGLLLGFKREAAMRISFLLSIPAIGLSGLYELFQERDHLAEAGFGGLIVGTLVSAVVGYATIAALLRFLRSHTTLVFVIYRIGMGLLIFVLLYFEKIK